MPASVTPPGQAGRTTYRLDREPAVGVLWVYADGRPDGSYRRVGGGAYDAATGTYGQGAYDADDVSRAAVVYLGHWRQFGDLLSRTEAYQLLRGLTYLQTAAGPDAGNVVLWMQPDGTLNPSPIPTETPDPSDSGASYWLARTIWALGVGYAAFKTADPAFAAFVRGRLDLAIAALDRQVLVRYGEYQIVDGRRVPAWLVVDGADASSEAVLGLSAYVEAGGSAAARVALARLAAGIAEMGGGDNDTWWTVAADVQPRLLTAVLNRVPGPAGRSTFATAAGTLGAVGYGGGGAQGVSAAPGMLLPVAVRRYLPAGATGLTAVDTGGSGQLDALLLTPLVSTLATRGDDSGVVLLSSVAGTARRLTIEVPDRDAQWPTARTTVAGSPAPSSARVRSPLR